MHSALPLLGMDQGQLLCPTVFLGQWSGSNITAQAVPQLASLSLPAIALSPQPLPPLQTYVVWLSITSFSSSLKALITFCTKAFLLNSLQARPLSQLQLRWLPIPLQTQRWSPSPGTLSPDLVPAAHRSGGQASPAMYALTRTSFPANIHRIVVYI